MASMGSLSQSAGVGSRSERLKMSKASRTLKVPFKYNCSLSVMCQSQNEPVFW